MGSATLWRNRLAKRRVWKRLLLERFSEPVHLNVASLGVMALGGFRTKVDWDLVVRPQYAYGVLKAADLARSAGLREVTVVEFGVASGAGLVNLATIAAQVTAETGVRVRVHGFDTGTGMPPARDYRDHPDAYQQGDFPMDVDALREILPPDVQLHLGPTAETIPAFLASVPATAPIGFVALDVDYYSSTVEALEVFKSSPERYLPLTVVYADDISLECHNSACGVLLAVSEFCQAMPMRPLEPSRFFETSRVFRRGAWVKQIFFLHVLDHPKRSTVAATSTKRYIENPHLRAEQPAEHFSAGPRRP